MQLICEIYFRYEVHSDHISNPQRLYIAVHISYRSYFQSDLLLYSTIHVSHVADDSGFDELSVIRPPKLACVTR